jgi:small multidrug resistance pump
LAWLMLAGAILSEVIATLALRGTADSFRPVLISAVIAGYVVSFLLMAVALRTLNVGLVYAIWSGAGTAAVAAVAALLYDERLNLTAVCGMVLIVVGVAVLASSGTTSHT